MTDPITLTEVVARAISGTGLIRDRDTEEVIALVFEAIEASGTHVVAPVEPDAAFVLSIAERLNPAATPNKVRAIAFDFLGYHRAMVARPKVTG